MRNRSQAVGQGIVSADLTATGDFYIRPNGAIGVFVEQHKQIRTIHPNGTYPVSDSVGIFNGKPHSADRFLTLQSQSEAGVIVKLKDNCEGFIDPANPKTILSVYKGQQTGDVMHSYVRNLTVDAGAGNRGAVGLVFISNNVGAMDRVTIRSSDPNGAGKIGLDLSQAQNGPCFIKRVTVTGFDTGIETGDNFSLVLEHITLKNQNVVGFNNTARTTIRGLTSVNRVTAVKNDKHDFLTLIEADLTGGSIETGAAITSSNPKIYLRDIKQSGYAGVVKDSKGQIVGKEELTEWFDGKGQALFPVEITSLRLPIEETPDVAWQTDLSKWTKVEPDSDAEEIQEVIDSAAKTGKTTLYFPKGAKYRITKPIRVHGSINRIIGMSNIVDVADPYDEFKNGKDVFTFEDLSADTLVVERFLLLGGWKCPDHVTMFENKSGKTIVLKDLGVAGITKKAEPGGRWFIEDISPSRTSTLAVGKGEKIWAPIQSRVTQSRDDRRGRRATLDPWVENRRPGDAPAGARSGQCRNHQRGCVSVVGRSDARPADVHHQGFKRQRHAGFLPSQDAFFRHRRGDGWRNLSHVETRRTQKLPPPALSGGWKEAVIRLAFRFEN